MRQAPPSRGFRFSHPDLDERPGGLRVGATGAPELVEGPEAVRQAVLLLLSTTPGERVMRPDYGCDLHRLLFSPLDETTMGLAKYYVTRALQRWEPRIALLAVDANRSPDDPGRLEVSLEYRVRSTQHKDRLVLPLQLTGEEG